MPYYVKRNEIILYVLTWKDLEDMLEVIKAVHRPVYIVYYHLGKEQK